MPVGKQSNYGGRKIPGVNISFSSQLSSFAKYLLESKKQFNTSYQHGA